MAIVCYTKGRISESMEYLAKLQKAGVEDFEYNAQLAKNLHYLGL
jgi:hypothetical protein